MSGVVNVCCDGCPFSSIVWWMSGVVDVWCAGSPVWWMSGVVDVLFYPWCGWCLVRWMSSVVDVCVVDVVQSSCSIRKTTIALHSGQETQSMVTHMPQFARQIYTSQCDSQETLCKISRNICSLIVLQIITTCPNQSSHNTCIGFTSQSAVFFVCDSVLSRSVLLLQ